MTESSTPGSATPGAEHVLIVGGSIAALGAALALTDRGIDVTCVEKDHTPWPADHLQAWQSWQRRGASQTRHSHVLLAPIVNRIKTRFPDLHQRLLDCGAEELGFRDVAANTFDEPQWQDGDDDIAFLACRRVVFEYVLRDYILSRPAATDSARGTLTFVDGVSVTGLDVVGNAVGGVHTDDGRTIAASAVVDASGRYSNAPRWFADAGLTPPAETAEQCGIYYTSRFYELMPGAEYPPMDGRKSLSGGVQGVDLGYLKVGLFRSDNRTFSITLAADPEDADIRPIAQSDAFDIAVANIDATRGWVDPAVSRPISKVYLYGNLQNARRRYVVDDEPLALNFFAIGDAVVHTNPLAGRGCALGWVGAFNLADVLSTETNPRRRALAFDATVTRDLLPWYRSQVGQDRQAIEINKALQRGENPFDFVRPDGSIDEERQRMVIFRKGFGRAARDDIDVLRLLFRQVNLLDTPDAVARREDLIAKVLAGYEAVRQEDARQRPLRDDMIALFQARAAG